MADPADGIGNDSDALLARADRLLGRHRRPATEVPTLTEELAPAPSPAATAGDDIPLLTDVIETPTPDAPPLPDPQEVSRAVEHALAGLGTELPPAQREEMRQSLEATLFEQMRKLRTTPAADPVAPPDSDKPPV